MSAQQDPGRVESHQRITGQIDFPSSRTGDYLHLAIARAEKHIGTIREIDIEDAAAMAGVVQVITAASLATALGAAPSVGAQPLLAGEEVTYLGEPVALVLATDPRTARRAARAIGVRLEPRAPITSLTDALRDGAREVNADYPSNVAAHWKLRHGDAEAAFGACERVYEAEYWSPAANHVPMEAHTCFAVPTQQGIRVVTGTQHPLGVRSTVSKTFGIGSDDVLVETLPMGGAFGAKLQVKVECYAVAGALCAKAPVRLELDRRDVFHTVKKHPTLVAVKAGVVGQRIVARTMEIYYDGGAYPPVTASRSGMLRGAGPYFTPDISIDAYSVVTNTVPSGAIRGSMTSQIVFAYESQMDDIARDLGIDPLEFRRRHLIRSGDVYLTGDTIEGVAFDEIVDDLEKVVASWAREPLGSTESTGRVRRGTGTAIMIKTTGTPSRSDARVYFDDRGDTSILCGSTDMGQGGYETLRIIAADELGVPVETVRVKPFTTESGLFDSMTASSRTTFSMGAAISTACADLVGKLLGEEDRRAIESLTPDERRIHYASRLLARGERFLAAEGTYESFGGASKLDPETGQGPNPTVHWHQGGAAVEVQVDLDTGIVEVVRCHGVAYAGRVINESAAHGQNEGCMVLGIGTTLLEEMVIDEAGVANPNLDDYLIPSMSDIPVVTSTLIESADPRAEPHGIGEMVIPAVAPAIGNALREATGRRFTVLPFDPERVLRGLQESGDV